ncbi:hypothetical protein RND81_07G155000 [Saponaria officinalis]|uniref:Endonuclease/exonuclease/phosphatase domain-containing protein n=1 Tax=Saponaria officinalis TaxID=3572 RepID=A0AAW1JRP1_SAPOF
MSIIGLNCRGLGNTSAVHGLRDLVRREAPAAIFLCEIKLSSREMDTVKASLKNYFWLAVDSAGRSGGLAFLWRKDVICELRSMASHHMDFTIHLGERPWRITGFYGDFNEIMFPTDMKGGERAYRQMLDFREAIEDCHLSDLGYVGYGYTYDNGQPEKRNRQTRLDRALISEEWRDLFPRAQFVNMDKEWSDHSPIKIILCHNDQASVNRRRIFRFEQTWVEDDACEDVIEEAWSTGGAELGDKISRCATHLTNWKGNSFGAIVKDLKKKRRKLRRLNEGGRSEAQVRERKRLIADIGAFVKQEEMYWRQRSRVL